MIKNIKYLIDRLKIKNDNILLLNSICISIEICFKNILLQKIDNEQYRGVIFYCKRGLFPRYARDFKGMLADINYDILEQCIPDLEEEKISNSKKIRDFLIERIEEHLAKQIQKTKNRRVKGGVSGGMVSGEVEAVDVIDETFDRPKNLIGLIETCLQYYNRNLMIIINNAEDVINLDFESSINDIFAAGDAKDKFAALTLVCSCPNKFTEFTKTDIWFEFSPKDKVKEKDSINCIWKRLNSTEKKIFKNDIILLEKILIESDGSTGIIRQKWETIYPTIQ